MSFAAPAAPQDNNNDQSNIALNALTNAQFSDRLHTGKNFDKQFAPMVMRVLKNHTVEEKAHIAVINVKYVLSELLAKIDRYKESVALQEAIGGFHIADIITINNDLIQCENDITNFLKELEATPEDITNKNHKGNLDHSYKMLVENIDAMLGKIHEVYEKLFYKGERIIPLS